MAKKKAVRKRVKKAVKKQTPEPVEEPAVEEPAVEPVVSESPPESKEPKAFSPSYDTLSELAEWFCDGMPDCRCNVSVDKESVLRLENRQEQLLVGNVIGWCAQQKGDGKPTAIDYVTAWLNAQSDDEIEKNEGIRTASPIFNDLPEDQKQLAVSTCKRIGEFVRVSSEREDYVQSPDQ